MENIKDEFRKEFCECCGSQRCSGQDDELVHCERFKNLMDNSGKPSVKNHKMGPKSKLPSKYYEDRMEETQSKRDIDKSEFIIKHMILPNKVDDKLEYEIIDGYEFDKVENGIIILKPIKPKYPTTYEECYDEGNTELHFIYVDKDERDLYESFIQLIRCRNAYWKIAGEQMGLDKPWEPDWNGHEFKYGLKFMGHRIEKTSEMTVSHVLCFPTEEMRDAFYENFKNLIESCKELL